MVQQKVKKTGTTKNVYLDFQILFITVSHPGLPVSECPYIEVFSSMKALCETPACRGSRHWAFCGQVMCYRGYMKLMGIGKNRFSVLSKAARAGETNCPYDARFIPRGQQPPSEKRSRIHQFLLELYEDVAEYIPDGLNSNKRPRHGELKIDPGNMDRSDIRHLPAASINDYFRQCKASLKDETISRKLFCRVPWLLLNSFTIFGGTRQTVKLCFLFGFSKKEKIIFA